MKGRQQAASTAQSYQGNTVRAHGLVVDSQGEPVVGASVVQKGSKSNGTVTDVEGFYTLDVPRGSSLEISCIGMVTQQVKAGQQSVVTMSDDSNALNEEVVVGYGTQKKVNLTGAVTSINFDDKMNSRPLTNVSSALTGMSAGMAVAQSTGKPGSSATINIRGIGTLNDNQPLVLVDGVEWSMDNVNPADIESISVLKDASSTAIYGALGANGVILITTKKGSGKIKFNYLGSVTAQQAHNKLELVSDYPEHMRLANETAYQREMNPYYTQETIDMWEAAKKTPDAVNDYGTPYSKAYPNTDWFDAIFDTGVSTNHHISMTGSSDKSNFAVSLGYYNNPGVMNIADGVDSGVKKVSFQSRIEGKVGNWLTLGANIMGSRSHLGMADTGTLFQYLALTVPGIYPGGENHIYGAPGNPEESSNANNILKNSDVGGRNIRKDANLQGYFIAKIIEGLSVEGRYDYQEYNQEANSWGTPTQLYNFTNNSVSWASTLDDAKINFANYRSERKSVDLIVRYNKTFGTDHEFAAMAGYNGQWYDYRNNNSSKRGMSSWTLHEQSTASINENINSYYTNWRMSSWFGRLNYAYKSRYLAEVNLRYDGSSRFSPDSRWGLFPSFSAGWRISEEAFMAKTRSWLSNMKLRVSYGKVGNNRTSDYAWQSTYKVTPVVLADAMVSGLKIDRIGNNNLEWETTKSFDLGLDLGFLNNRLTAELDYYTKKTTGILYSPSLYLTMGVKGGTTQNFADVSNRGFEATVNWNDHIGEVTYNVGANIAFNRNRVTKYKGQLEQYWDENGNYVNNIGEVSEAGFGTQGRIIEGHKMGDTYLKRPYSGTGNYNGGELDVNAGPKDGIIRTEQDLQWVKAMIAAGYKFEGKTVVRRNNLWYGDLIYADTNGDGNYGDSNDYRFTGHSNTPKTNYSFHFSAAYKGFDLYALFTGAAGFYLYYQPNFTIQPGYGAYKYIADDHYYYDPENSSFPTNVSAKYPRLGGTNSSTSTFWEYKGDYLKLKNLQLGYTLPATLTQHLSIDKIRFYVSAENLCTWTSYPGMDPEMGNAVTYPIMKQYSFGMQLTF